MTCAILILGAQMPGGLMLTKESGRYVVDFDIANHTGRGPIPSTPDISKAKHFANAGEAIEFWRTQSKVRPLREDGEPNRPMTAYTIEVRNVE